MAQAARNQPQGLIRVNRAHPLFKSLAFAYVAQGNNRFVGYTAPGSIGITDQAPIDSAVRATPVGIGKYNKTGGAFVSNASVAALVSSSYSLFAYGTNATTSGTSQAIDDDNGGGARNFQFRLNAGKVDLITFAGGSPFFATQPTALTLAQQASGFTMGASVSPTTIASFQNGNKVQTAVSGSNAPSGTVYIGASKATTSSMWANGGIALVMGWSRTLTDDEQKSLAANPWQLFDAPSQTQLIGSSSTVPTGTTVTATPGTLAANGLPASVSSATSIAGAVATLAASGQSATVTLPTAVAATIATSAAAGRTAAVTLPTVIGATSGTSAASGLAATVSTGAAISASAGTVTAAGQTATISTQLNIAATPGASTVAGLGATIVSGAAIVASVGTVTATGLSATLVTTTTINATCGTGAASGLLASIQSGAAISATTGQITATGRTASIVSGVSINCGVGVASAAGRAAFIPVATLVSCISGAATAVGLTASIALDRPAPLPNRHNLYSGLPRNRAYLGAARNRNYKGQP